MINLDYVLTALALTAFVALNVAMLSLMLLGMLRSRQATAKAAERCPCENCMFDRAHRRARLMMQAEDIALAAWRAKARR